MQKHLLTLTRPCCSAEEATFVLAKHAFRDLCCSLVIMMQSTQHGNGDHLVRLIWWRSRKRLQIRKPLPDPLMWPRLIVVHNIGFEETVELFLLQDQEMIQAFSPDASQKAFADGICSWRPVRRSKHFDTCAGYLGYPFHSFAICRSGVARVSCISSSSIGLLTLLYVRMT